MVCLVMLFLSVTLFKHCGANWFLFTQYNPNCFKKENVLSSVHVHFSLQGFFKRSITRGDKYKCFFGGECDLTPKSRNRCKSCRFKRCLETGMSVEGKAA